MKNNIADFTERMHNEEKCSTLALAESMLSEMAMSLDDFKDRVLHLQFQLVENWCICKWCQMFDVDNENFFHWLTEFKVYASALQHIKLKSGSKKKTLAKEFIENYEYSNPNSILKIVKEKFDYEGIRSSKQKKAVAVEFSKKIGDIISSICSSAPISSYIRKEFNLDNAQ